MKKTTRFGGKKKGIVVILLIFILMGIYLLVKDNFFTVHAENLVYTSIETSSSQNENIKAGVIHSNETPLPVQINAQNDFQDYQQKFFLPKDTIIHINATGEAADYSSNPFLFRPWDNDGIEFFLKMNNNAAPVFDMINGDRQYRILWKTLKIDGQNPSLKGFKVTEVDPSQHSYIMSVTIPWKLLGNISPHANLIFGFDATIIDSDGGSEKAKIDWHNKTDDNWRSTVNYGAMVLSVNKIAGDTDLIVATERRKNSFAFSSKTLSEYKNVTVGYVRDARDLSGKFRAEWDKDNLYLQVFVNDDIKTVAQALFDYGWIEDRKGKVIWKMKMENLRYAGGALKNKYVDTVIRLKKGQYVLKYHTDESHSPQKWDDKPPKFKFYGIKIE